MIAWHPTSHNFPIEMIDIYERPGSECASIPLYGNCGNDSAHAVFDGILLINSDKTNCVTLFVCIWLGIVWTDVCDRCSCIRTIYCVGVANIFDIMGHIYNIILIGFPWYLCSYHRWQLPVNYPVFTVVMEIYHYVERIWRILVTPNFCIEYTKMKNIIQVNQLILIYNQ